MTIRETYRRLHPHSAELHQEAVKTFPSGVTHDIRHLEPFPLYVDHASGSRKWDVDGNEIVDYVMGHGALFLGHAYPEITEAVQEQVVRGTHYGAGHELELKWGAAVRRLVPSAEMVRFTSSGTEATMMAIRLARAFTSRRTGRPSQVGTWTPFVIASIGCPASSCHVSVAVRPWSCDTALAPVA